MGNPENPETIILKNKFYPKGLTEGMVYNYYSKVKSLILNQTQGKDLMIVIMVDVNKPIIKRKIKGKPIILTPSNYDDINIGRTISIYSTMKFYENHFIIDIDADTFEKSKQPTLDVYHSLNGSGFVSDISIRYTGKTGFHIDCELKRKTKIDSARILFEHYLKSKLGNKYTIRPSRVKGTPNIDLWASNKLNGAYITLNSLSIIGLRCMNLMPTQLNSFKQENAKII